MRFDPENRILSDDQALRKSFSKLGDGKRMCFEPWFQRMDHDFLDFFSIFSHYAMQVETKRGTHWIAYSTVKRYASCKDCALTTHLLIPYLE